MQNAIIWRMVPPRSLIMSVTHHHHTNNHLLSPSSIESLDQKFNHLFFRHQPSVSKHLGFFIALGLEEEEKEGKYRGSDIIKHPPDRCTCRLGLDPRSFYSQGSPFGSRRHPGSAHRDQAGQRNRPPCYLQSAKR